MLLSLHLFDSFSDDICDNIIFFERGVLLSRINNFVSSNLYLHMNLCNRFGLYKETINNDNTPYSKKFSRALETPQPRFWVLEIDDWKWYSFSSNLGTLRFSHNSLNAWELVTRLTRIGPFSSKKACNARAVI